MDIKKFHNQNSQMSHQIQSGSGRMSNPPIGQMDVGMISISERTSAEKIPPQPPPVSSNTNNANMGNKTGGQGHLRLGGLSRYLMEKVQSNDSGLDLSPATLQKLVHPLRSSGSSTSSLHVRSLFESPASSDESPQSEAKPARSPSPVVSRSILSEQSHNCSETTMIEKTLTDDATANNITYNKKGTIVDQQSSVKLINKITHSQSFQKSQVNPDDVTPKGRGFQVPLGNQKKKSKQLYSNSSENTDPGVAAFLGMQNNVNPYGSSVPAADVAAVIPPNPNDPLTRKAFHTPKHNPSKHKKPSTSTSTKKQTGWKFLSEHVQEKEYLIIKQLGKGGCGEVSLVIEKDTRKLFALKVVRLHGIDDALVQECINEVEMLIDLKGTDLVVEIQSWEFNRSEKTMKIVMEHGQCDLNHSIYKVKQPSIWKLKAIWERLLLIVDKIHNRGIVHADLKPANFIWVGDNLKIIDFGIASRLQSDLTSIAMPNPKGTLNFISPETIHLDDSGRSKLSPKSDIWALGCILYLMVYGRSPFEHISHPVTKMNAIMTGDIHYPTLPPHLQSSQVQSVLRLCFQTDYKRRPTAAELLRHPFLHS